MTLASPPVPLPEDGSIDELIEAIADSLDRYLVLQTLPIGYAPERGLYILCSSGETFAIALPPPPPPKP